MCDPLEDNSVCSLPHSEEINPINYLATTELSVYFFSHLSCPDPNTENHFISKLYVTLYAGKMSLNWEILLS